MNSGSNDVLTQRFNTNLGQCLESQNLTNLNGTKPYPQTQRCPNRTTKENNLKIMNNDLQDAYQKQAVISRHYQFCPCDTLTNLHSIKNKRGCSRNTLNTGPKGSLPYNYLCDLGVYHPSKPVKKRKVKCTQESLNQ